MPATKTVEVFNPYFVYAVRCTVTGWVYVSVRKVSEKAFMSLLKTGARDPNFDQPIHRSFREHGAEAHTIKRLGTYEAKEDAQEHQTRLIEQNAKRGIGLNASRPSAFASEDFQWLSYAATADDKAPAKKAKKATKKAAAKKVADVAAAA
jgi:hypothetical protein